VSAGLGLWQFATVILDTQEPWDSGYYIAFYVGALSLSALFGYLYTEHAWLWGFTVVFAQLPVMMIHADVDGLLLVGILFLSALTVPAMVVSRSASQLRKVRQHQ
jgi:hypothetical protein